MDIGFASIGSQEVDVFRGRELLYPFVTDYANRLVVADGGAVTPLFATEYLTAPLLARQQAENITVPWASKVSTIYGVNPITGAIIPFAFSRASVGVYIDSNGILQSAAVNVPRLDYDPITKAAKGYLLENAATNFLLDSSTIATTATLSGATITRLVATTAPDGSTTSSTVTENTTTGEHYISFNNTISAQTTYTFSAFCKAKEKTKIRILFSNNQTEGKGAIFNLITGVMESVNADGTDFKGVAAGIKNVGNGWYRCWVTANKGITVNTSFRPQISLLNDAASSGTYTGVANSSCYVWGLQLELGTAFSSYIRTTTAQVTRSADAASFTVPSTGSLFINNNGVKTVQTVNPGTFTLPVGTIKSLALFPRILTASEITQVTA